MSEEKPSKNENGTVRMRRWPTLEAAAGILALAPVLCAVQYGLMFVLIRWTFRDFEALGVEETWRLPNAVGLMCAAAMLAGCSGSAGLFVVLSLRAPPGEVSHTSRDMLIAFVVIATAAIAHALTQGMLLRGRAAFVANCVVAAVVIAAAGLLLHERVRRRWRWPGVGLPGVLVALMCAVGAVCVRGPLVWVLMGSGAAFSLDLVALTREEFEAQCRRERPVLPTETMRRAAIVAVIAFALFVVGVSAAVALRVYCLR